MNKLEELLAIYCPNGVEYKALGEVCEFGRGRSLSREVRGLGETPIILYGELYTTYSNYIYEIASRTSFEIAQKATKAKKTDILMPVTSTTKEAQIGKASAICVDEDVYIGGDTIILSHQQNTGYLVYLLNGRYFEKLKMQCRSGTTVSHLSREGIAKIKIPVPPLEVQNEIVSILDNLTEFTVKLKTELATEFAARKQQYEYYRDKLLTFEDNSAVKVDWIPLSKVAKVSRGVRVLKKDLPEKGAYPVYQDSLMPMGYYNDYNGKANTTFMIGAGSAGEIGYSTINFWAADDCFIFDCEDCLLDRFLYYILMSKQAYIFSRVRKASIPRLARDVVEKLIIPIPPIKVQKQIVNLLDNFNAFYSDLSAGLSSEIEARQKQYEYYRDKLLMFKEK